MVAPQATASSATTLLTKLTTPPEGAVAATGRMNEGNIKAAKGLIFSEMSKMGAVVGFEQSSGFLIVRKEDGSWSAPTFLAGKGLSAGITIGASHVSTLVVLFSDKAIEHARRGFKLGIDFSITAGPLDVVSGKEFDIATINTDSVAFGVGTGILADLSLAGGTMHPDAARNEAAYGAGANADSILATAEPPAEFGALYEKLRDVEAHAGIPGQAVPAHPVSIGGYERALA